MKKNSEKKNNQTGAENTLAQSLTATLLTRRQVAEALGLCDHSIARYTRMGQLPCIKFNRRVVRYDAQVVDAFIRAAAGK